MRSLEDRPYAIDFSNEKQLTKQSQKQECDIHYILKNFLKTGEFNHLNPVRASYGDFDNATDYLQAQLQIQEAQAAFASLPSEIRDRMDDSPAVLMDFLANPDNLEEAIELGLLERDEPAPPPGPSGPGS